VLDSMFTNVISSTESQITPFSFFICTLASLVLGFLIAKFFMIRCNPSKNLIVTIALLPMMVQAVIMLVNGSLGTAVAVAGAFSLVRFRSLSGTAKEIAAVFLAMSAGLAIGVGYIAIAFAYVIIVLIFNVIYTLMDLGKPSPTSKELKITIPESLDYSGLFDDIFSKYTNFNELTKVRTTNMGSLYQLHYSIMLKDISQEKTMIDELRCRNGNLDILCGRPCSDKNIL